MPKIEAKVKVATGAQKVGSQQRKKVFNQFDIKNSDRLHFNVKAYNWWYEVKIRFRLLFVILNVDKKMFTWMKIILKARGEGGAGVLLE